MMKDNHVAGEGNAYYTLFREYDPDLGRWWRPDPIFQPWQSPYSAFDGNPIMLTDVWGLEAKKEPLKGFTPEDPLITPDVVFTDNRIENKRPFYSTPSAADATGVSQRFQRLTIPNNNTAQSQDNSNNWDIRITANDINTPTSSIWSEVGQIEWHNPEAEDYMNVIIEISNLATGYYFYGEAVIKASDADKYIKMVKDRAIETVNRLQTLPKSTRIEFLAKSLSYKILKTTSRILGVYGVAISLKNTYKGILKNDHKEILLGLADIGIGLLTLASLSTGGAVVVGVLAVAWTFGGRDLFWHYIGKDAVKGIENIDSENLMKTSKYKQRWEY